MTKNKAVQSWLAQQISIVKSWTTATPSTLINYYNDIMQTSSAET